MASKAAHKRLMKEYAALQQEMPPFILARPSEKNILEWHYVITGPPDSPYEGGEYHGKVLFPADYPFKPPAIQMITPNGRFQTNARLCLSMSDYHPEQWNPSWSVASILTGLLSFMLEKTSTTGSLETTEIEKRILAKQSRRYNRESNARFADHFPELYREPIEKPVLIDLTQDDGNRHARSSATAQNGTDSTTHSQSTVSRASPSTRPAPSNGAVVGSLQKPMVLRDALDHDVVGRELGGLMQSGFIRLLLGGMVFYVMVRWLFPGVL